MDDIIARLTDAGMKRAEADPEIADLLAEAAEAIRDLRVLVGIREEVEFEDMPVAGRA